MAERKAVIKNADMSEDMQQDAVDCASQALDQFNIEKVSGAHEPCIDAHGAVG
jgi:dynein light chain LC8-type